ncbi:HET and ankyrin domain protein [Phaeosphaeria sp. MPI-PUGE-AT-0046c]|nr:HET and ankyrin domain protein [Phaeosphaeria sp. MPI-PUGE-AT-0046c]
MRLLKIEATGGLTMINCTGRHVPPYAILSHTWMGDENEVSYEDWTAGIGELKAGYAKIRSCADQAIRDDLHHIWVDTCCIQKSSSAELSEAINSMYAWYQDAARCYAFLSDVPSKSVFSSSLWFTRGWTLQELIAPATLIFFDETWTPLGSKIDLQHAVSECTGIPASVLSGSEHFETFSIAQRMSWAAKRVTTRVEDMAYCMLGLFDINMPLIYGEGENAFMRLQEEILKISEDHSLFAWRSTDNRGGCLATSPASFSGSNNIVHLGSSTAYSEPTIVSSSGIHLELPFIGTCRDRLGFAMLNCVEKGNRTKLVAICVRDLTLTMNRFERVCTGAFELLDIRRFRSSQYPIRRLCIQKGRIRRGPIAKLSTALVSIPFPDGRSISGSLLEAAAKGRDDEAWFFLSKRETDVNAVDSQKVTALYHVAVNGNEQILGMLLGRSDIDLNPGDTLGLTPLFWAAKRGHIAIVKMLLDTGKLDVNSRGSNGWAPLSIAAKEGHEAVVKLLLLEAEKIEVDLKDSDNRTPLSWAAEAGHEAVVKLLLYTGKVNVDSRSKKMTWTPLIRAARFGHDKMVALLIGDSGKAYVDLPDGNGRTPLSWAMEYGHEKVVKLLLATRLVNVNAEDRNGLTPLMWAAKNKHAGVMQLLLSTEKVDRIPKSVKDL